MTISVPNLLDPNENDQEASRAASALGGRFLQVSEREVEHGQTGTLIDFTHFKGPPGNSRPSSSRMLSFGSVVDAAMVKKNGGKKKNVMSGDEVRTTKQYHNTFNKTC